MTARPILFSAPMVRALLDGSKTQTRRVVKPQPQFMELQGARHFLMPKQKGWQPMGPLNWRRHAAALCPYGKPGSLLWVRETWAPVSPDEYPRLFADCNIEYRADKPNCARAGGWEEAPDDPDAIRWRSSIHMPRWASRLTLRITDVRVERLQDISEDDARNEGVSNAESFRGIGVDEAMANRYAYRELWQTINGPGSWDANPWVWALTFDVTPRNVGDVLTAPEVKP